MPQVKVEALIFGFPENWHVSRYDEWSFYRNQFCRVGDSVKAVDLLAMTPDRVLFLVEVKDYRRHQRTKRLSLPREMARKVMDTLAALMPAALRANDNAEMASARTFLRAAYLRVVLHLEQPAKHSAMFPRAIDPIEVQAALRQLLKAVDPRASVVESGRMGALLWEVQAL